MQGCGPLGAVKTALHKSGVPVASVRARGPGVGPESECGAVRVNLAGNRISSLVTPTNITEFERLFRRNPVDGTLTATPSRPFTFELGTIEVPQQMAFVMMDFRFAIYVPSDVAVGDTRELEDRRLSTVMGYDVRLTDTRDADISYELEPSNPSLGADTFAAGGGTTPSQFDRIRAQETGSAASGSSTMPQRHRREAQLEMPFTYIVNENKRLNFKAVIFRPIPIPISFFQVEVSGFLMGLNALTEFTRSIAMCKRPGSV